MSKCAWNDTLQIRILHDALHRERLTCSCLTVRENGSVETLKNILNYWCCNLVIYINLITIWSVRSIERKLLRRGFGIVRIVDFYCRVLGIDLGRGFVSVRFFLMTQRTYSNNNFYAFTFGLYSSCFSQFRTHLFRRFFNVFIFLFCFTTRVLNFSEFLTERNQNLYFPTEPVNYRSIDRL